MKTNDLLKSFKHGQKRPSDELWQQLLWNAANIVKLAEIERRTYRIAREKSPKRDSRQMELFNDEERR